MADQKKAYFYAFLSIIFWSTVASAFKLTLRYISHVELLAISTLASTSLLFLILLGKGRTRELKKLRSSDLLVSLGMGFLNPFLYYLCIFKAYALLPAQQAQPLNLIWGIVIVVFSIPLLKQKVRLRTFFSIFTGFLGVIIISTKGNFLFLQVNSPLGVGLALGSSVIWSIYWLINARDQLDPLIRLFLNFCAGSILVWILVFFFHPLRMLPLPGIGGAIYTGLFEMGLTFYFWLKALKLSETTAKISILIYIMPFISLVFIRIFLGEKILLSSIAGLALIVSGIILEQLSGFKKKAVNP